MALLPLQPLTTQRIYPAADSIQWTNAATVNPFIVRATVPTFAKVSGLGTSLSNTELRLYGLTVSADSAGAVSFGRLTFRVDESIGAAASVRNFKFYRGTTLLSGAVGTQKVNVFDGTGAAGFDVNAALMTDVTAPIVVSFNTEESVGAGSSSTYYLDATAVGVTLTGETITTKLDTSDENTTVAAITGVGCLAPLNWNGNANTGRVFDVLVPALCGLFTAANDFVDATTVPAARSIIWSDGSADGHTYPTVAAGAVTTGTGSWDWTNGYLLGLNALTSQTLTK